VGNESGHVQKINASRVFSTAQLKRGNWCAATGRARPAE
jgi:hypothetical protein